MPRYKITVEYLGTNFSGWQKQKNSYSIQEAIERSAKKLLQQKIDLSVNQTTLYFHHLKTKIQMIAVKK